METEEKKEYVLRELTNILNSRNFGSSSVNNNKFAYIIQESRMRENLSRRVGIDEGTRETVRQLPELRPCPTLQSAAADRRTGSVKIVKQGKY